MGTHEKINLKAEIKKIAITKGEMVPYSSKPNPCNYAIDISYWGCISPVGTDPESQTIYRDYLIEFSELVTN